jgi:LysM repeat protein
VPGLDINENWCTISVDDPLDTLIYRCWGDDVHMHTMLHDRGQHVGAGVSVSGERVYVVLDVAAYWGDAGLTAQPTTSAYGDTTAGSYRVSQYIAPVTKATTAPDGSITHIVMSGQSLWMIAHHYEVEIERIMQLNTLGMDDMIYIGQKVLIQPPSPATPTSSATATSQITPVSQKTTSTADQWENSPSENTRSTSSPVPQSTSRDESGWFLAFFGLFGIGVVLVVLSLSTKS